METLANKKRYNSKRKRTQRKLNNRIGIAMTFQETIKWCDFEPPYLIYKKIKEEDKQAMKEIR